MAKMKPSTFQISKIVRAGRKGPYRSREKRANISRLERARSAGKKGPVSLNQ